MQSIVKLPIIGLDLVKSVFQLHIVDAEFGEIQRRQIKRAKLTELFAKCQPSHRGDGDMRVSGLLGQNDPLNRA